MTRKNWIFENLKTKKTCHTDRPRPMSDRLVFQSSKMYVRIPIFRVNELVHELVYLSIYMHVASNARMKYIMCRILHDCHEGIL